jgi:hypothetical protein
VATRKHVQLRVLVEDDIKVTPVHPSPHLLFTLKAILKSLVSLLRYQVKYSSVENKEQVIADYLAEKG